MNQTYRQSICEEDIVSEIANQMPLFLDMSNTPAVRQFVEIFLTKFVLNFPQETIRQYIIPALSDVSLVPRTRNSLALVKLL